MGHEADLALHCTRKHDACMNGHGRMEQLGLDLSRRSFLTTIVAELSRSSGTLIIYQPIFRHLLLTREL
jgi:hypothetical protein